MFKLFKKFFIQFRAWRARKILINKFGLDEIVLEENVVLAKQIDKESRVRR